MIEEAECCKAANPDANANGLVFRWRRYRVTRPHLTVRISRMLGRLRLYGPTMRMLHKCGQCFMTQRLDPDGRKLRECTWCGCRHREIDRRAAEASLRAASASQKQQSA